MQLARVIGTVVCTVKDPSLVGVKILMIQPLGDDLKPVGDPIAACDVVQAGPGSLVHWTSARESSMALPIPFAPVDAAITGIVDDVDVEDVGILEKEKIFGGGT